MIKKRSLEIYFGLEKKTKKLVEVTIGFDESGSGECECSACYVGPAPREHVEDSDIKGDLSSVVIGIQNKFIIIGEQPDLLLSQKELITEPTVL